MSFVARCWKSTADLRSRIIDWTIWRRLIAYGLIALMELNTQNADDPRARVFISCGQSKESDERAIAEAIAKRLKARGFEPWVAVELQTLNGIKEHIFQTLRDSEYFIFIDFKREQLAGGHRGSLFSHQELAVASYLGVELLAFQEAGVMREGLLSFIGANATSFEFEDRSKLPDRIDEEVAKRKWNPYWRNEVIIERESTQYEDVETQTPGLYRRFFHVSVRNRHRHRAVTNCYAYLESATKLDPMTPIPLRAFELKWEGFLLPFVNIPASQSRRFDAFCIHHNTPTRLSFSGMFSDWNKIIPLIQGEGCYKLNFLVVSSDFAPARASLSLNLAPRSARPL